jgi:hypothetical protein
MVFGPGDDRDAVQAEYRNAWRTHGEAVAAAGLDLEHDVPSSLRLDDARVAWRLDGRPWKRSALPPRRERRRA